MRVKNVSGSTRTFSFSKSCARVLADDATVTIPDTPENIAQALVFADRRLLQVVDVSNTPVTVLAHPKTITCTIDSDGAAGTVVIGGTTLTLVGASATLLAANLVSQINAHADLMDAGVYAHAAVNGASSSKIVFIEVPSSADISPIGDYATLGTADNMAFAAGAQAAADEQVLVMAIASATAGSGQPAAALHIVTPLRTIVDYRIRCTAAGVMKNLDATVSVTGGVISLATNAAEGAVVLADGDVVTVTAFGTRQGS